MRFTASLCHLKVKAVVFSSLTGNLLTGACVLRQLNIINYKALQSTNNSLDVVLKWSRRTLKIILYVCVLFVDSFVSLNNYKIKNEFKICLKSKIICKYITHVRNFNVFHYVHWYCLGLTGIEIRSPGK